VDPAGALAGACATAAPASSKPVSSETISRRFSMMISPLLILDSMPASTTIEKAVWGRRGSIPESVKRIVTIESLRSAICVHLAYPDNFWPIETREKNKKNRAAIADHPNQG
jgi:hypothetical protein